MIYHGEINQLMRGFTNSWLQISESPMVPLVLSSDGPVRVRGVESHHETARLPSFGDFVEQSWGPVSRISPCQGQSLQSSKSCCDLAVTLTKLVWEREWECNPTNSRQFLKKRYDFVFWLPDILYAYQKNLCY